MSIALKTIIEELQVATDTKITVVYVGSPYKKVKRNKEVFDVFYIEETGKNIKKVEVPCNKFQLIYPGYMFKNGEYMGVSNEEVEKTVVWEKVYNIKEDLPLEVLLEEKGYKLSDNGDNIAEKYISFVSEGVTYNVPCVQIVQTFFANHKILLNWILQGKTGFDDVIESEHVSFGDLKINFVPWFVDVLTKSAVEAMALIRYVPEMQREWLEVIATYIENGTLISNIPSIPGLRISCEGIMINNTFNINRIIWLDAPKLKLNGEPFTYIEIFPQKEKKHKDKNNKKKKHDEATLRTSESDVVVLRDKSSQQGKRIRSERRSAKGFSLSSRIKSVWKEKDEQAHYTQDVGINENTNNASLNNPTENGMVPQVNIEFSGLWQETQIIEGFEEFCLAIGEIQKIEISDFRLFHGCVKSARKRLKVSSENPECEKYAAAVISIKRFNRKWLIVEPGWTPVSTLIIAAEIDEESQAEKLISNLINVGHGHWTSKCLENNKLLQDNELIHNKNRTPHKWANKMLEKIYTL